MGDPVEIERQVVVLARNRRRLASSAWPLLFVLGGLVMLAGGDDSFVTFMLMGIVLSGASLSRAYEANEEPDAVPTQLAIEGRRLTLDGESYDIDALRSGYILPGDPPRMRLHVAERRLAIDVAFPTRDDAEDVLEALALSPRQRIASFRTFAPHRRGWRGALETLATVVPFLVGIAAFGPSMFWLPLALLAVVAAKLWRRHAHVGSDGIRLERGVLFDRFIPHEAITWLGPEHTTRRNEVHVLIRVDGEDDARAGFRSEQQAQAFIARVEAARRARDENLQPVAQALARRDEATAADWVARLHAVTSLGAHRTAALAREQLWSVVETPSAQPLQRAAAAVALSRHLDESTKKRIAEVASATASPRLRVVLDAVHDEAEDGVVAEALAELEEEQTSHAAHGARPHHHAGLP